MSRAKTIYSCQSCGSSFPRWLGRCSTCGEWQTIVEEIQSAPSSSLEVTLQRSERISSKPVKLDVEQVAKASADPANHAASRRSTGIGELDRVLGGGLVRDSFVLLGGDPGIGKSTLLLQVAFGCKAKILYISGEESVDQLSARAVRLTQSRPRQSTDIHLVAETSLERAFEHVREIQPDILIMDSLQTFSSESLESPPGSVGQVREIAHRLMQLAKQNNLCVWLVGHVTKEGAIAGPKMVEHMVDTVLYFEGEEQQDFRLLRAIKNRFGNARELGVFEMTALGLREVQNPSELFLSDRNEALPGVATTAIIEGSRCILIELQALVAASPLSLPRRTAVGMEPSRLSILAAIVERHTGVTLSQQDLFFNVAGGLRLSEPAADLAAMVAIWSSAKNQPIPSDWLWLGEVGLTGEVRRVSQPEMRIEEARKLGFKKIVLPASTLRSLNSKAAAKSASQTAGDIELIAISMASDLERILKRPFTSSSRGVPQDPRRPDVHGAPTHSSAV